MIYIALGSVCVGLAKCMSVSVKCIVLAYWHDSALYDRCTIEMELFRTNEKCNDDCAEMHV